MNYLNLKRAWELDSILKAAAANALNPPTKVPLVYVVIHYQEVLCSNLDSFSSYFG